MQINHRACDFFKIIAGEIYLKSPKDWTIYIYFQSINAEIKGIYDLNEKLGQKQFEEDLDYLLDKKWIRFNPIFPDERFDSISYVGTVFLDIPGMVEYRKYLNFLEAWGRSVGT